jgi:hypothetical protein
MAEQKSTVRQAKEITPAEAARRKKVLLSWMYNLIWSGKVLAYKREGRWAVDVASLDSYKPRQ